MKKGFVLLLTLLFISAALSVSLGVATLVIGEIGLSGTGRESQLAFYAADAGVECAIYRDLSGDFGTAGTINNACAGQNITVSVPSFSFSLSFDNGSCVDVTVDKTSGTKIDARGYNTGDVISGQCVGEGRRVQRGLEASY